MCETMYHSWSPKDITCGCHSKMCDEVQLQQLGFFLMHLLFVTSSRIINF